MGPSIALKDHYRVSSTGILNVNTRQLKTPHHDWSALIDRGANGCIAGREMKVIETTMRTIDLSGIDDHTVRNLTIVKQQVPLYALISGRSLSSSIRQQI
jgi:hypothetical protein